MNVLISLSEFRPAPPRESRAVAEWRATITKTAAPASMPLVHPRSVEPVPDLVICEGGASPLDRRSARRTTQGRHAFTFLLCVAGRLAMRSDVASVSLEAGQATVFPDTISVELQCDEHSQIVALRFEGDRAKAFQPMMDKPEPRAVAIDLAAAALFLNYCNILVESAEHLSPSCASLATAQLRELAALMLNRPTDAGSKLSFGGPKAARLRAVLGDIAANLRDPQLNAVKVGARLGLTPRYVQLLMEGFGKSFSEHVREMRLDEARRMLRDARADHLRITEIAYAAGFQDISYFNRAFRGRFGEQPSATRGIR